MDVQGIPQRGAAYCKGVPDECNETLLLVAYILKKRGKRFGRYLGISDI